VDDDNRDEILERLEERMHLFAPTVRDLFESAGNGQDAFRTSEICLRVIKSTNSIFSELRTLVKRGELEKVVVKLDDDGRTRVVLYKKKKGKEVEE
jgi:hypothetical protein